ncbi:MAG: class I SAM-dependent methyltransferase [Anaerolineales bacterium]
MRKRIRDTGLYPAGHYYSPIPKQEEIVAYLESTKIDKLELPAIDLNRQNQFELLTAFQAFYKDLPFPEKNNQECRYYYGQSYFCYADAIFLYSFLRYMNPQRIIEVGSGFSSAVILDTVERFFSPQPEMTFIDPYPDRLRQLLRPHDAVTARIIERKVQEVPTGIFSSLRAGDLLFIDSSHVVKCGSDLHFLMFEVLPQLPAGVFVHFHDVFYPFEYPAEWLLKGRYWNEDYFLRAFLSYNSAWEIFFFNTYVATAFKDFLLEKMPLCLKNTGGSLYIRRTGKG